MGFRLFALVLAFFATTTAAHAYIDPGTGSFVLQMVLAGLLAVGTTVKLFWIRIKEGIRRFMPGSVRSPHNPT